MDFISYGSKARVSLGEMKCWHLGCKSLGRGGFCALLNIVRPTYGFKQVGVSSFGRPLWGRSQGTPFELVAKAKMTC